MVLILFFVQAGAFRFTSSPQRSRKCRAWGKTVSGPNIQLPFSPSVYCVPDQSAHPGPLTPLLELSFPLVNGSWYENILHLFPWLQLQTGEFEFLDAAINFHIRRPMARFWKSYDFCPLPKMCSGSIPIVTLQGFVQVAGEVGIEKRPENSWYLMELRGK